eukprot:gi/632977831/ref/XP_007905566.1/ PREDICTED: supervillin-like [Callorhinchus milii]
MLSFTLLLQHQDDGGSDGTECLQQWAPVYSSLYVPTVTQSLHVLNLHQRARTEVSAQLTVEERKRLMTKREEEWKCQGKGAANDSGQFTVAGRMASKGLVSPSGREEPAPTFKKVDPAASTLSPPLTEIARLPDQPVESDEGLDKLESFLNRLHTKTAGHRETTLEVTAQTVREVMRPDDEETFCRFYRPPSAMVTGSPTDISQSFDLILDSGSNRLTSEMAEHRRSVRPLRRTQSSRNPLRALAAREDLRQEYTELRLNVASVEAERIRAEKLAKHSTFSDTALAGLASKENFQEVNLRSVRGSGVPSHHHKVTLIQVKGRRHVQSRSVESSAHSLNSGDCFLLLAPRHCFLWVGEFANVIERSKASELATYIQRKRDLGCQAPHVTVIEEGINSESPQSRKFWELLGGQTEYQLAGEPEEDEVYEAAVTETNCVYRLREDRLLPDTQASGSVPRCSLLSPTQVLVFDFGSEVYVWHGREVPVGQRKLATELGKQLCGVPYDYSRFPVNPLNPGARPNGAPALGPARPGWVTCVRLAEHNETILFKEKFLDWTECRGSLHREPESAGESKGDRELELSPCDARTLLPGPGKPPGMLLEGVDVRRGYGKVSLGEGRAAEVSTVAVRVWHVAECEHRPLSPESHGQLHEADTYVVHCFPARC